MTKLRKHDRDLEEGFTPAIVNAAITIRKEVVANELDLEIETERATSMEGAAL